MLKLLMLCRARRAPGRTLPPSHFDLAKDRDAANASEIKDSSVHNGDLTKAQARTTHARSIRPAHKPGGEVYPGEDRG